MTPPPPPQEEDLVNILPLLRRPELLASLRFIGKPISAQAVKPLLIREVMAVLRGGEGSAKRDAIGETCFFSFFLHVER